MSRCVVEYQEDGSSMNMFKQYLNNPNGFAFLRKTEILCTSSKKRCFIECIHNVSSSIISKNKHFVKESPKRAMTVCAIPFGIILTVLIKKKSKSLMKVN